MTDQTTNYEAEDVLSSIRRLVSEDLRHLTSGESAGTGARAELSAEWETEAGGDDGPAAETDEPAGAALPDADMQTAEAAPAATFILTPDFMVGAPSAESPAEAPGPVPAEEADGPGTGGDLAEPVIPGGGLLSSYGDVGAGAGDPVALWETDRPSHRIRAERDSPAEAFSLEDTIADLEQAVALRAEDFEPDGGDAGMAAFLAPPPAPAGAAQTGPAEEPATHSDAEEAEPADIAAAEAGAAAHDVAAPSPVAEEDHAGRRRGEAQRALEALRRQSRLHLLDSTDPSVAAFVPDDYGRLGHIGISELFSSDDAEADLALLPDEPAFQHRADRPYVLSGDELAVLPADPGVGGYAADRTGTEPLAAESRATECTDEPEADEPAAGAAEPATETGVAEAALGAMDDAGAPSAAVAADDDRPGIVIVPRADLAGQDDAEDLVADMAPAIGDAVAAGLGSSVMGGLVQDAIARLAVPEDGPGISPAMQQDETPASDRTAEALQRAEALIDVDLLRQMVAEMIRHELQGPLGERITRNVRKLVRREINRALENRDIDQI